MKSFTLVSLLLNLLLLSNVEAIKGKQRKTARKPAIPRAAVTEEERFLGKGGSSSSSGDWFNNNGKFEISDEGFAILVKEVDTDGMVLFQGTITTGEHLTRTPLRHTLGQIPTTTITTLETQITTAEVLDTTTMHSIKDTMVIKVENIPILMEHKPTTTTLMMVLAFGVGLDLHLDLLQLLLQLHMSWLLK